MQDLVSNFLRIIPKQGCEDWMIKLNEMSRLVIEAEYQMVKKGYRPAATVHVYPEMLDQQLQRFNKDGLIFTPLRKAGYAQGYLHSHKPVKPGEPFYWYGCLTRTKEDGEKFKKADLIGINGRPDHITIGKMLGFPECCCKYFDKNFPKNYDTVWLGREGKVKGYPECNVLLRYFGARIIHHLSCSPTCKESKKIGQIWLEVMREIDKNLTEEIYDLLAGPIIWDSYHGVVQVETPYFVGLTHTFPFLKKPRVIKWSSI